MKKLLLFSYAVFAYIMAMASVTILIFWVYPWSFMPFGIDKGESGHYAAAVDLLLIALFGLQHSVMARSWFKERFFHGRHESFRASTYTVASAVALFLLYGFWQPLPDTLWRFDSGIMFWSISALYGFGWLFAFVATFQIDHFELFGLHQGYRALKGLREPEPRFQKKGFYKWVRHPIQIGTLIGIWATPQMSTGHLLFSTAMSVYVLIGLWFEEKTLMKTLGKEYEAYRKTVPMLLPFTLFRGGRP